MNILFELFLSFAKIGAFTFGGGYAMLSLIDHEFVDKKKWLTDEELAEITVIAESTPGPIAINCATYTGYKKAGIKGAIAATLGMVLPSFIIILLVSFFFQEMMKYEYISNAFKGIRVAVGVLIIQAAVKMIKKMLKRTKANKLSVAFIVVFFAIAFTLNLINIHISTIYLILISGITGALIFSRKKEKKK